MPLCRFQDCGLISYDEAYTLQMEGVRSVLSGGPGLLVFCEHPPVLTLGRSTRTGHVLADPEALRIRGVAVRDIDRGGDVTLHSPGQLVAYPILDLKSYGRDLKSYLSKLEQVTIDFLAFFDIMSDRNPGLTGVWVGPKKIASVGVGVKKWISYHGLAVNVHTDLTLFSLIKPCGLDVQMTSVQEIKGRRVDWQQAQSTLKAAFARRFDLDYHEH